jgi:hypothetical protein
MELRTERHGSDWCRRKFVGRVRARIEPARGVVSISSARQDALQLASRMLSEHCRMCGKCELKIAPP